MESGGTENYLLRFLRSLEEKDNIEVTIICKGGNTGSLEEEFKQLRAHIEILKLGYTDLKSILYFKNLLNKEYDVVCDLTGNFAGISMLLARINKVPKRISFYRASSNRFIASTINNTYNSIMKRLVYRFSTDILSNSQAAFDFFYPKENRKDDRFKVIRNGMDIDLFSKEMNKNQLREKYGLPEDLYLIGHVGRWNPAKNYPTIFKVADSLINEQVELNNIAFVFCGRETDSPNFQKHLLDNNILKNSFTLGEQSKVHEVLKCLDLFYFPSVTEGQPNALLEAMVSGLPFVASNIEAIKESIPENAYSQLVEPLNVEDHVLKIKEAILDEKSFIHSEWAKNEYQSEDRFNDFKKILISKYS